MIVPPSLSLMPFQVEGVELMLKHLTKTGGVYNGDDMGLGKTIQTITVLNTLLPCHPHEPSKTVWIICPAVMRLVWKDELLTWMIPKSYHTDIQVYRSSADFKEIGHHSINIISYDLARTETFVRLLLKSTLLIDFLILDEAHKVKTTKSKRSRAVFKYIWPIALNKIALSGTPFTKSIEDGYSLFHKFNPEYFPDWRTYVNTYMNRKNNGFGIQYEGLKNEKKLKAGLKSFFFRRVKEKVLPQLPAVTYKKVPLDSSYAVKLSADQKKMVEEYYNELRELLGKDGNFKAKPPPIPVMTARREQGKKKTPPIIEYVKILLEQSHPVVLFGIFLSELKLYEEAFKSYKPGIIYGAVSDADRAEHIRRFQSGETLLFIGQMQAAGEGITLTKSENVVLAETSYSPAEIKQCIDRVHRIGQKGNVTVHYFVVEESIDEKILDKVMKKAETFWKVLS